MSEVTPNSNPSNISSYPDLISYQENRGFYNNISDMNNFWKMMLVLIPGMSVVLSYLSWRVGYRSFIIEFPYNLILSTDMALVILAVYFLEVNFTESIRDMRDVFEVNDETYYSFFGQLYETMYFVSPFGQANLKGRVHIMNRVLFLLLLVIVVAAIYIVGIAPVVFTNSITDIIYLSYILLLGIMTLIGSFFLSWLSAVFLYFMGYKISSFGVRLDATRSPENLGFDGYGMFLLKLMSIPFTAVLITGWTSFVEPNVFVYFLTAGGSIAVPVAFVGSQYGIHKGIQRSKEEQLRNIRSNYSKDIDRWFTKNDTEYDGSNIQREVRVNSMLSVKNEIRDLPEWPTNANTFKRLGATLLIPNIPTLINIIG